MQIFQTILHKKNYGTLYSYLESNYLEKKWEKKMEYLAAKDGTHQEVCGNMSYLKPLGKEYNMPSLYYQWTNSSGNVATTCDNDWYSVPTGTGTTSDWDWDTYGSNDYKIIKNKYGENFLKYYKYYKNLPLYDSTSSASTIYYGYGPRSYEEAQTGNWGWWTCEDPVPVSPPLTPAERLKQILADRHGPAIHVRPSKYYKPEDEREIRARETLRRVVGERNYRYFLKTGCVNVRGGKSGMMYRIYKGHMVDAYKDGVLVERLCVYLKGNFPPADEIITKFLMIINNEEQFRTIANISKPAKSLWPKDAFEQIPALEAEARSRPLPEIFRELKAA